MKTWILGSFGLASLLVAMPVHAEDAPGPDAAAKAFLEAVQRGDAAATYELDYVEQFHARGKFASEQAERKNAYAKRFQGNPSICPGTSGEIDCHGTSEKRALEAARLLLPPGAAFDVQEWVFSDDEKKKGRVLVKVTLPQGNCPIHVTGLKTRSSSGGGMSAVGPAFFPDSGILTAANPFFARNRTKSGFALQYVQKGIREASLDVRVQKLGDRWLVSELAWPDNGFRYYDNVQGSGRAEDRPMPPQPPLFAGRPVPKAGDDLGGDWLWTQYWRAETSVSRLLGECQWTRQPTAGYQVVTRWTRGDVAKSATSQAVAAEGIVFLRDPSKPDVLSFFPAGKADGCLVGAAIWIADGVRKSAGLQICRKGVAWDDALIESWEGGKTLRLVRDTLASHRKTLPPEVVDLLQRWQAPQP